MNNKDQKNDWKTLSTKTVYENNWIKVNENKIINPSGNNGIYGVVHFKNVAIGIVPLDEENNTYLVGQWRYALNEYSWELPMGGAPTDDYLLHAQRELEEETGWKAKKWQNIMKLHTSNSICDEVGYVFLAQELEQGEMQWEETEKLEIQKLPFQKAYQMVLNGQITDAISVAGILRVKVILDDKK